MVQYVGKSVGVWQSLICTKQGGNWSLSSNAKFFKGCGYGLCTYILLLKYLPKLYMWNVKGGLGFEKAQILSAKNGKNFCNVR